MHLTIQLHQQDLYWTLKRAIVPKLLLVVVMTHLQAGAFTLRKMYTESTISLQTLAYIHCAPNFFIYDNPKLF